MDHKLPFKPRPLVLSRGSTYSFIWAYKLLDFIYILLFMYDYFCGVGTFFILISSVSAGGQSMAEVWGWVQCSCVRGSGSSEHRPFYYSSPRARVHSCGLELDCIILLTYPEPGPGAGYGRGNVAAQGLVCLSHIYKGLPACAAACCQKYGFSTLCLEASNFEITLKW